MQDPQIGRWFNIDPKADDYFSHSLCNYALNNPLSVIDPDGQSTQSTHTDSLGNVLAVFNDGDNSVYKHDGNATTQSVEEAHTADNTSAGGAKMGETEYWDAFALHNNNGEIIGNKAENFADFGAHINYGITKDGQMAYLAAYVKAILGMQNGFDALRFLMNTSQNGGWLDIKVALGANQGYLF